MESPLQNIVINETSTLSELHETIGTLMNIIEEVHSTNKSLLVENRELKDEINRLKGEQEMPKFPPQGGKKNRKDYSSEKNRKAAGDKSSNKNSQKGSRKSRIQIDKRVRIGVCKKDLPFDAKFTGYCEVIQQNLKLVRENILYEVAVYYSPSQRGTIRGKLPDEWEGQYGSELKSLLHSLHHVCDVTQGRLECLLHSMGMVISSGTISNMINSELGWAKEEQRAILHAGITGSDYLQTDSTSNKEKGEKRTTHIFSGDYFSVYHTLKTKSRLSVLHGLQGGLGAGALQVQYNEYTDKLLQHYNISKSDTQALIRCFGQGISHDLAIFKSMVQQEIPALANKKNMFTRVLNAFALSYYYAQTQMPVVEVLLSDDAPEYKMVASKQQALCWIHDARYYNKLTPVVPKHRKLVEQFMQQYWSFYRLLLDFRVIDKQQTALITAKREEIEQEFDQIFTQTTQYNQLDKLIEKTYQKKKHLLVVLDVPALPLHNNAAELAARRVVRKRDISLHTWSHKGTLTRDAFMSIVETAIKVGINPIEYITKRIRGQQIFDTLVARIKQAYQHNTTPAF